MDNKNLFDEMDMNHKVVYSTFECGTLSLLPAL